MSALQEAYDELEGAQWERSKNWMVALKVAHWEGVEATSDGFGVQGLVLSRNGLEGTFPDALCRLSGLTTLALEDNRSPHPV